MAYIPKNYHADGGDEWVIGGKLTLKEGAEVDGFDATTTKTGTVKMAAKVAEAAGANPTAAEFKALLDALKAAGIMSST